jgi:hypothetical protein
MAAASVLDDLSKRTVELASARRAGGGELSPTWLAAQLGMARGNIPRWEDLTGQTPDERCERLLAEADGIELRIAYWPHRAYLGFHDHGGSTGAFVVGHGTIVERYAACGDAPVASRTVHPGRTLGFGAEYIHELTSTFGPATALFIASPPTRANRHYALVASGLRPLVLESAA